LFHRDCGCEESCCDSGCGHKFGGWLHRGCGCESSCDSCGDCGCGGHRWGGKLRGLFHRGCCDTCDSCGGCGGCGAGGPPPLKAEPIAPPKDSKKMPAEPKKQVQAPAPGLTIENQATDLNPAPAKRAEAAPSLSIEPPAKGPFE
jgi:hypothetical protein